jgi:hypothetical protein
MPRRKPLDIHTDIHVPPYGETPDNVLPIPNHVFQLIAVRYDGGLDFPRPLPTMHQAMMMLRGYKRHPAWVARAKDPITKDLREELYNLKPKDITAEKLGEFGLKIMHTQKRPSPVLVETKASVTASVARRSSFVYIMA